MNVIIVGEHAIILERINGASSEFWDFNWYKIEKMFPQFRSIPPRHSRSISRN